MGGSLKKGPLKEIWLEYEKRLSWPLTTHEIVTSRQEEENTLFFSKIPPQSFLVILDEKGENLSSSAFAQYLKSHFLKGTKNMTFLIGGANGISPFIKEKAQKTLSFGAQTWPHLLVRILFIEQLYRAQQILAHHPYHRET